MSLINSSRYHQTLFLIIIPDPRKSIYYFLLFTGNLSIHFYLSTLKLSLTNYTEVYSLINLWHPNWFSPVGCSCRIHRLYECLAYDTKLSESDVPVMLKLWGMQSTPSLPSLPGPPWLGVVAPDRVLSMGQIESNCVLMLNWIV